MQSSNALIISVLVTYSTVVIMGLTCNHHPGISGIHGSISLTLIICLCMLYKFTQHNETHQFLKSKTSAGSLAKRLYNHAPLYAIGGIVCAVGTGSFHYLQHFIGTHALLILKLSLLLAILDCTYVTVTDAISA